MIEVKNISSAIRHYAEKTPDKTYLIYDDKKYTYSQINEILNKICFLYESLDLKKGNVISAIIKNCTEYVFLYLSALRYGCIFNPYPYTLESRDIYRYISNVEPTIVFCQDRHYKDMKAYGKFDVFFVKDDLITTLKDTNKTYNDFLPRDDSPACIYYSSGTTGNPKGVVFSHKNMISNISSIIRGFRFDSNEIHLIILPLGHTASINYSFLPCTLGGGTIVLTESFWKVRGNFWKYIKKYKITYVEMVPSILVALFNTPYKKEEYKNVKTLKFIGCGSATLPKELQIKFIEKYGVKVANLYGLSETGPTHIDYPLEVGWKPGSIGKPLDVNDVKIMDENGHILGLGQVGEIIIKGENVFIDYYKNHDLYEKVVKDNYFHTGDLGYVTDEDIFFFTGRKKDLIIKGGINISPDEIDEILFKMNEIEEALTVGIADEYLGEKIVSYIVLKDRKYLGEKEVIAFCKKYLSRDKIPDKIQFVDTLPKGHSGKLLRRKIRVELNET